MSYWFLEETEDGQFWCDLPTSHKGKVCKHELALNYLHKTNSKDSHTLLSQDGHF